MPSWSQLKLYSQQGFLFMLTLGAGFLGIAGLGSTCDENGVEFELVICTARSDHLF